MTDDVEQRLRAVLSRKADAAPRGEAMLTAVRVESGRRRHRRQLAGAGGLSALAVLLALGVSTIVSSSGSSTADRPRVAVAAVPAAEVTLVAGPPPRVTFPFTPQVALVGSTTPTVVVDAGRPTLRYGPSGAEITVANTPFPPGIPASAVTVRGHPGTVWLDESGGRVLSWAERSDLWLRISVPAAEPIKDDDLIKYAGALITKPMTGPAPFAFDLVPAGFALDTMESSVITFCPPDVALGGSFVDKIAVLLGDASSKASGGRPVTVAGRVGQLNTTPDATIVLQFDDGAGRFLTVQVGPNIHFADAELLRFAAGIHPTSSARPGQG